MLQAINEILQTEEKDDVHPGLGEDLNLGPAK